MRYDKMDDAKKTFKEVEKKVKWANEQVAKAEKERAAKELERQALAEKQLEQLAQLGGPAPKRRRLPRGEQKKQNASANAEVILGDEANEPSKGLFFVDTPKGRVPVLREETAEDLWYLDPMATRKKSAKEQKYVSKIDLLEPIALGKPITIPPAEDPIVLEDVEIFLYHFDGFVCTIASPSSKTILTAYRRALPTHHATSRPLRME